MTIPSPSAIGRLTEEKTTLPRRTPAYSAEWDELPVLALAPFSATLLKWVSLRGLYALLDSPGSSLPSAVVFWGTTPVHRTALQHYVTRLVHDFSPIGHFSSGCVSGSMQW